jgi:hypothetical protein
VCIPRGGALVPSPVRQGAAALLFGFQLRAAVCAPAVDVVYLEYVEEIGDPSCCQLSPSAIQLLAPGVGVRGTERTSRLTSRHS